MGRLCQDLRIYDRESSLKKIGKQESTTCCNNPCCWYNPPQDSLLVEYFQETYLHGLKFVAQPSRHLVERIFWCLSFIVGVLIAGYLISDVWRKYQTSPVILAFNPLDLSISEIQFPTVTICNINKVQKNYAEKVRNRLNKTGYTEIRAQQEYYVMNSVCTSKPTFAKRVPEGKKLFFDESLMKPPRNSSINYVADFLHKASQPCDEMLQRCSWAGSVVECSKIFFPVITELGICCTFNIMPLSLLLKFPETSAPKFPSNKKEAKNLIKEKRGWQEIANLSHLTDDFASNSNFPRRQYQAGQTHGLSILLFPDLDNYYCTASDSSGFRVAFHSAIETPRVTEFGMAVPPGADMYVEVYPEVTMTDPVVATFPVVSGGTVWFYTKIGINWVFFYTDMAWNFFWSFFNIFAQSDRHCYFQREKELKYYNYYTQLNCIDECESDLHRMKCNCSWFYEPRNTSTLVCVPNDETSGCTSYLKATFAQKATLKTRCAHCLPLCTQIKFGIQSSLSAILNASSLWKTPEEIKPAKKPIWFGKPVTILNVYYGDDTIVPKQRKELYGSTDLFANTGGLLGLCLGFSGLSAVEILYFCTIRLWFRKKGIRTFRRAIKSGIKKLSSWGRKDKGQGPSNDPYNFNVTLEKSRIPFWPPLKPLLNVSRIEVGSLTELKTSNSSQYKIGSPALPEYPLV